MCKNFWSRLENNVMIGPMSLFQRHHFHSLAVHGDCAVRDPGGHGGHGHLHRPVALGEAGHHSLVHAHRDLDQSWGEKGDCWWRSGSASDAGWTGHPAQFLRESHTHFHTITPRLHPLSILYNRRPGKKSQEKLWKHASEHGVPNLPRDDTPASDCRKHSPSLSLRGALRTVTCLWQENKPLPTSPSLCCLNGPLGKASICCLIFGYTSFANPFCLCSNSLSLTKHFPPSYPGSCHCHST